MCFGSYKNHKLKVKLWWVGDCERKKRGFFVPFILSEWIFLKICLSQFVVYWIHIHAFTYQKTLLRTILLFVFKIIESLQCILKNSFCNRRPVAAFKLALLYALNGYWAHKQNDKQECLLIMIFLKLCT